jgi:hypothetical protein
VVRAGRGMCMQRCTVQRYNVTIGSCVGQLMQGQGHRRTVGVYILDPNDRDDPSDDKLLLPKWLSFSVEQETIPFTRTALYRSPAGVVFVPVGFFVKAIGKIGVHFVEAEDEEHPKGEDLDDTSSENDRIKGAILAEAIYRYGCQ